MSDDRHLRSIPPEDDYAPRQPPNDEQAERHVLGAMLTSKQAISDCTKILLGTDFYRPNHEVIYDAIVHLYARLEPVDAITVADYLTDTKDLARVGGQAYLHELMGGVPNTANADYHALIVSKKATRRRLTEAGTRIQALGYADDADDAELFTAATKTLQDVPATIPGLEDTNPGGLTIDELLVEDDDEYDWIIPGILERGDRLILTGGEGSGKSTLLRQIAVQSGAGIHPFHLDPVPPINVLVVDFENSKRQNRRAFRTLRHQAPHLDPAHLVIHSKPDGLDLTQPCDEAWLDRMLTYHHPDLLITGPIYKLAGGNPNDEKDAKPAAMALDRLRTHHDCALILEAHSAKGQGAKSAKNRSKEPFGWSGWMRWPDFGIHIDDQGELTHWRGMRDQRDFPSYLQRGGIWPWMPAMNLNDQRWVQIRDVIKAAGKKLTERELSDAISVPNSSIHRLLAEHSMELVVLYSHLEIED